MRLSATNLMMMTKMNSKDLLGDDFAQHSPVDNYIMFAVDLRVLDQLSELDFKRVTLKEKPSIIAFLMGIVAGDKTRLLSARNEIKDSVFVPHTATLIQSSKAHTIEMIEAIADAIENEQQPLYDFFLAGGEEDRKFLHDYFFDTYTVDDRRLAKMMIAQRRKGLPN